jgi:hypothetical protein
VNSGSSYPGSGFFPPALSPVPISNPETGLQNIRPSTDDGQFQKRLSLMNEFDSSFRKKFQSEDVKAYTEFYDETMKLMKSEVQFGGWDMHNNIDTALNGTGATMDKVFAALIEDLAATGLLESTMVVMGSEFGRTPDVNENEGRDHYPLAYSTVFAGGGVKGGYTYGATDKDGRRVADKQVSPSDFQATIGHAMGLPVDEVVMSPSNRPFTVGDKGAPVLDIFA